MLAMTVRFYEKGGEHVRLQGGSNGTKEDAPVVQQAV